MTSPRFEKIIAEDNPGYPPDAEIITLVFKKNLNDVSRGGGDNPITYATLDERGVQYYSFPDPRFEPTKSTNTTETTDSEPKSDSEGYQCCPSQIRLRI
jgi:hypothetical protein